MKAEFYYNKRKYTCCIVKTDLLLELRIRNEKGEVLAIEQGNKIGLQGKKREASKQVDVSQPYFYNLIKTAMSALEIADKNQLIREKDKVIEKQNEQINILNQQLYLINKTENLSGEQEQKLNQLQKNLTQQEAIVADQKQRILRLEGELSQLPQTLPLESIEKQVISKLGKSVWNCLHPASQRDLCNAYRCYQMIKSDNFAGEVADYSTAGHPLGIVAEREIIAPFFKQLYQFILNKNDRINLSADITFEIGGILLKSNGEYTLGDLPALISSHWEAFIKSILKENIFTGKNLYRTVDRSDRVTHSDRQIIKQFLEQWQHPLSGWLTQGQVAASTIDQIRQLRNIANHSVPMYHWQFKVLWLQLVGSQTHPGVLQEIYANSNSVRNHADKLKEGTASGSSPSYSYLVGSACS